MLKSENRRVYHIENSPTLFADSLASSFVKKELDVSCASLTWNGNGVRIVNPYVVG